jgi:hypothetical protein
MLTAVGALVTVVNLAIALIIGVRLVRLGAATAGPERWLGGYFLLYPFLSSLFSCALYMGWSDPSLALGGGVEAGMNAAFFAVSTLGMGCLLVFTVRTFRPDAGWARGVAWGAAALLAGGALGVGLTEGYRVRVLPGAAYWLVLAVRQLVFLWVAAESLRYWGLLRRRLQLGLADPLVANRFLLWGAWAAGVFLLGLSDPLARLWYCLDTGTTTEWVPEAGRTITLTVIALTSLVGIGVAGTLFLTFFPTEGFRRWVASRAPAAPSASASAD